jgi:hypothetical protein
MHSWDTEPYKQVNCSYKLVIRSRMNCRTNRINCRTILMNKQPHKQVNCSYKLVIRSRMNCSINRINCRIILINSRSQKKLGQSYLNSFPHIYAAAETQSCCRAVNRPHKSERTFVQTWTHRKARMPTVWI